MEIGAQGIDDNLATAIAVINKLSVIIDPEISYRLLTAIKHCWLTF